MNPVYTLDDLDREVAKREIELLEKSRRFLKGYAETWRRSAERETEEEKEASSPFQEGLCAGMEIVFKGCAEKLEYELESVEKSIKWAQEFLEELEACVAGLNKKTR